MESPQELTENNGSFDIVLHSLFDLKELVEHPPSSLVINNLSKVSLSREMAHYIYRVIGKPKESITFGDLINLYKEINLD